MFGAGLTDFIISSGLIVIAATIFIECGFFAGFFLPGDSLLFLAGFIAGQGQHNIVFTILIIFLAATLGNITGYYVGHKAGPKLFNKEDGIFFQKENILRAQHFYTRHGGKTLILARFVPVMRTFAPLVGGIGNMPFGKFFASSTAGAALWAILITSLGFWAFRVLGHSISIEKYVMPIVLAIILFSVAGSAFHGMRERHKYKGRVSARQLEQAQSETEEHVD